MNHWTIICGSSTVDGGDGEAPAVAASDLVALTGWSSKPQGWCRGAECIPASLLGSLATAASLPLDRLGDALGVPSATDADHRLAVIGERLDVGSSLAGGVAPDLELLGLDGRRHRLFEQSADKTVVVAFSSWCGCRYDLPDWQALGDELGPGLQIVAVAIDDAVEPVAPWAETVDFPVLVDTDRTFADAYGLVNVPTVIWVDGEGQVVRPPSPAFANDAFVSVHGIESGPHHDALRAWVRDGQLPGEPPELPGSSSGLDDDQRRARAEFRLALELIRRGHPDAAATHLATADELAPDDLSIWRAAMPLTGADPFGDEFFQRYTDWQQRHGGPLQRPVGG